MLLTAYDRVGEAVSEALRSSSDNRLQANKVSHLEAMVSRIQAELGECMAEMVLLDMMQSPELCTLRIIEGAKS